MCVCVHQSCHAVGVGVGVGVGVCDFAVYLSYMDIDIDTHTHTHTQDAAMELVRSTSDSSIGRFSICNPASVSFLSLCLCVCTCAHVPSLSSCKQVPCALAYTIAYSPCAPRPTDPVPRGQLWPVVSVYV